MRNVSTNARHPVARTAILVLGMHRSGTSALARAISLCGPALPPRLLEASFDNEACFWESPTIVALHDEALVAAGSAWDDILEIEPAWFESATAAYMRDRLAEAIVTEYADSRQFVVKDPRLCRLLPLWRPVLDRMGIATRVVITLRHPLDVAASLAARDAFTMGHSLTLWLRYLLAAERTSRDLMRYFVTYDALFADPITTLEKIGIALGICWHRSPHSAKAALETFLSPNLRHHDPKVDGDDFLSKRYPDVLTAWSRLLAISDSCYGVNPSTLNNISETFIPVETKFSPTFRALESELVKARREIAELRAQNTNDDVRAANELAEARREVAELRAQIGTLLCSTSWRLTSPMRNILSRMSGRQRMITRRVVKSFYWTVTPHRLPRRLAFLKRRRSTAVNPPVQNRQDTAFANIIAGRDRHFRDDNANIPDKRFDPGFYRFIADLSGESAQDPYEHYVKYRESTEICGSILDVSPEKIARLRSSSLTAELHKISVVVGIITYNTSMAQLKTIVQTAQQAAEWCPPECNLTVKILDNGSPLDMAELPEGVDFTRAIENGGFGHGHNELMRRAFEGGADAYIAANPDGAFHVDCLRHLLDLHIAKKGAALIEAIQFPEEHPKYYDPITFRTKWASGACLLIPRHIWEVIGGFDENIFLYCEDVDLSWRASKAGFEILTCPKALFWHDMSGREESDWRTREVLISSRYLAHKWGNTQFRQWIETLLVERKLAFSQEELPPIDDLPTIEDPGTVPEFEHEFHYAAVRWW